MNINHTPGPWRIGDAGHTVFGPPNGAPSPMTIAGKLRREDAKLICAAPQLLALVKQYRQEAISQGADVSDVQEIDAVLRAAGEDI